MNVVHVVGAKGGVGTSTVVAAFAVALSRAGVGVAVVDRTGSGHVGSIVQYADDPIVMLADESHAVGLFDVVLVDHPSGDAGRFGELPVGDRTLLVATNCFLAATSAVRFTWRPEAWVIVEEPKRALTRDDLFVALGCPTDRTLVIERDSSISRLLDSGLFPNRFPRQLARLHLASFLDRILNTPATIPNGAATGDA